MDFKDFRDNVQKKHDKTTFKIRNSWGVYDAYKAIRRNKWFDIGRPLKEHEFYSIIRGINDLYAEELSNGETVIFPLKMGKLELRKIQKGASIVNGKLKVTYPIDWAETIRLWFEDEEAHKNKILLRNEIKDNYRIVYSKYSANYNNSSYYDFALNRFIRKALLENVRQGKIESLW